MHPKRQTDAFTTDLKVGRPNAVPRNDERWNPNRCPRCSDKHELAECELFKTDDVGTRWEIVKRHKLCHACLKSGHMRARCESKMFCRCGSDRRHHKLLHHPYKRNKGDAEEEPQSGKQVQKLPAQSDYQVERELPSSVKPRTTEQYATVTGTVSKTVLLHVVPVKVIAPNGSVLTTYGLLDNAS